MNEHILTIEDEPAIASALGVRLGAFGYRTTAAHDGLTGLDVARRDRPDAILLDVRLPDIDGFEVCRQLKADTGLSEIPVVFLSANVQDETRRRAWEVGAAAYLSKPYDGTVLRQTLSQVIENRRPTEQAE